MESDIKPKPPKRAGNCKNVYGMYVVGGVSSMSQRVTWCCEKRHGFMVKHWKCVGVDNKDCPLKKVEA
jgi:hypothetical protein